MALVKIVYSQYSSHFLITYEENTYVPSTFIIYKLQCFNFVALWLKSFWKNHSYVL
jgi:hypothetical protein